MKLRMSRIVAWIDVDRAIGSRGALGGVLGDHLGQVLKRQRYRVQALNDRVMQVLADALALLDDRQPADLLVQPRVLDRDPGMQGEALDEARDRPR